MSSPTPSSTPLFPDPMSTITGQTSAGQYGFVDPYGVTNQLQGTLYGNASPFSGPVYGSSGILGGNPLFGSSGVLGGNALYGSGNVLSGGPLGTYNQNANQTMGQIAGLNGPLQQTLSGIANYQVNNALNAVGSNFANQGALGSGAAAQAFGQAIANPFAQAQSQLQQAQLGTAGSALQSLMGISGQAYNQALGSNVGAYGQALGSNIGAYNQALGSNVNAYGQALQGASNLMEHASGLVAPTYYTNPVFTASQNQQQQGKGAVTGIGTGLISVLPQLLKLIPGL